MGFLPCERKITRNPKRTKPGQRVRLTWLESAINFYLYFFTAFGWDKAKVDNCDLDYLLEIIVVKDKIEHPEDALQFIDEVKGI